MGTPLTARFYLPEEQLEMNCMGGTEVSINNLIDLCVRKKMDLFFRRLETGSLSLLTLVRETED
jgi:hypothetical protein